MFATFFLVLTLAGAPVVMPVPYGSFAACYAAGYTAARNAPDMDVNFVCVDGPAPLSVGGEE